MKYYSLILLPLLFTACSSTKGTKVSFDEFEEEANKIDTNHPYTRCIAKEKENNVQSTYTFIYEPETNTWTNGKENESGASQYINFPLLVVISNIRQLRQEKYCTTYINPFLLIGEVQRNGYYEKTKITFDKYGLTKKVYFVHKGEEEHYTASVSFDYYQN